MIHFHKINVGYIYQEVRTPIATDTSRYLRKQIASNCNKVDGTGIYLHSIFFPVTFS